jgi:hypothetical protein
MLTAETLQFWVQQKTGLEAEYPHLSCPSPDFILNKSQIFLTSIDELRVDCNPYDIDFSPENLEEGQNFDLLLTCELSCRGMPTNGTIRIKWESLCSALEVFLELNSQGPSGNSLSIRNWR